MDVAEVSGIVSGAVQVLPILLSAYQALKQAWTSQNPGKTEQDFLDTLKNASQKNIDDAKRILLADGYTVDADGNWHPPQA